MIKTFLAAAAVATLGLVLVPITAGSASTPELSGLTTASATLTGTRQLRVIQYNLTGAARPGTVPTTAPANNGSLSVLPYLDWEMGRFPSSGGSYPDAVLLEEVCAQQFADLKARYTPDTSKTYVVFQEMVKNHSLCPGTTTAPDDHRLGLVLLSRWPLTNVSDTPLGYTDTSYGVADKYIYFHLLCADQQVSGLPQPVKTCVTHLRGASGVPVDTYKGQVDTIAATLNPVVQAGQPVILGGDLNNKPGYRTLDPLYRLDRVGGWNGDGLLNEGDQTDSTWFSEGTNCTATACRSGQRTTAKLDSDGVVRDYYKFDYVFWSRYLSTQGGFTDPSALAMPFVTQTSSSTPYLSKSDHHLYRVQAILNY